MWNQTFYNRFWYTLYATYIYMLEYNAHEITFFVLYRRMRVQCYAAQTAQSCFCLRAKIYYLHEVIW